MIFTKSLCPHVQFEKSYLSIYTCKQCSIIQVMTLPKVLKKKNNDIFVKPKEYCFNYEINIIKLIKNQIHKEEKNFINYKKEIEKLNLKKNNATNKDNDINDNINNIYDEVNSYNSEESNSENDFLESFNIYYTNRKKIITYVKIICNKHNASKNCFYLTMALIEQFFKLSENKYINNYQMDLIINAIFVLAFKFIDTNSDYYICYKSFKTFFYKEKKSIKQSDLKSSEIQCLQILEYNLNVFTIFNFLELVLSSGIILEKEVINFNIISKIYNECYNLLDFCFEENNIIFEYSMTEIIFSIINLVRKHNNLVFNIKKYFSKIYNIELKDYLNCIKHISSLYYKNDNSPNNLIVLKNPQNKKYLFINEKKYQYDDIDIENIDNKQLLKEKFKKNENEKVSFLNLYDSGKMKNINKIMNIKSLMKNPLNFSKNKSLDNNNIKMIDLFKEKEKSNSILFESSNIPILKEKVDKIVLKPLRKNDLLSSRNINTRYKNISNNSSISSYNNSKNNNELKNKLYKNVNSININKSESKYLYNLRDSINNLNSKSNNIIKINKNKSCNDLMVPNPKFNNKKLINNIKKSFEIKDNINNNELSYKNKLNYYLNANNKNNEKSNEEYKDNIFQIMNKIKDNIKLPLIKK